MRTNLSGDIQAPSIVNNATHGYHHPTWRDHSDNQLGADDFTSTSRNYDDGHFSSNNRATLDTNSGDGVSSLRSNIGSIHDEWYSDVVEKMNERRKRWDHEMKQMRHDFFGKAKQRNTKNQASSNSGCLSSYCDTPQSENSGRLFASVGQDELSSGIASGNTISVDDSESNEGGSAGSNSCYVRDDIGNVYFQIRFDVSDFNPEDINISTNSNRLTVHAKREMNLVTKEFTRTMDLPENIKDFTKITCNIEKDGFLTLRAPVATPDYFSNMSEESSQVDKNSKNIYHPQVQEPVCRSSINYSDDKSQVVFSFEIGNNFQPQDLFIKTVGNKVYVGAKHEEKIQNKISFQEFTKDFDVPPEYNAQTLTAKLKNGYLYLTAKLL